MSKLKKEGKKAREARWKQEEQHINDVNAFMQALADYSSAVDYDAETEALKRIESVGAGLTAEEQAELGWG
jgi:hypothetical protein